MEQRLVNYGEYVRRLVQIISILGFLYLLLANPQAAISRQAMITLSVLILVLGLWISEYLSMAVSGLIGCFLLYFFGRYFNLEVLINNSFLGFSSPSVWFVFCGLVIGAAMRVSGLADRISLIILRSTRNSYSGFIFAVLILSIILIFVIPSTDARTVALMSLIASISSFHTEATENNMMKGLSVLIPVSSSILGVGVLASVTSITAVGLIEQYLGLQISYLKWLIMFLPAEILIMVSLYFLVTRIFPCSINIAQGKEWYEQEVAKLGPLTLQEKKTVIIIGSAIVLWFIGSFVSIRADIVAMACASALLLPCIGVIDKKELTTKVNWLVAPIFLGSAFSIVDCLKSTGMLDHIGKVLLGFTSGPFQGTNIFFQMLLICSLGIILHFFTAHSSMLIASFLPIILEWTVNSNLGVGIPLMFIWGSQFEFMAYQSSSLTIAYGYGAINGLDIIKLTAPLAIIQLFGGTLIFYFWWQILGIL